MHINYSDFVATLALVISAVVAATNLVLILLERIPRLKVIAEDQPWTDWDEDYHMEHLIGWIYWVHITNPSARRVQVNSVTAEYRTSRRPLSRRYTVELPEFGEEQEKKLQRFWIDPWGTETLMFDFDEFKYRIKRRKPKGRLWYWVRVEDALGNSYRSKSATLDV